MKHFTDKYFTEVGKKLVENAKKKKHTHKGLGYISG
jgi:hypothetical protein